MRRLPRRLVQSAFDKLKANDGERMVVDPSADLPQRQHALMADPADTAPPLQPLLPPALEASAPPAQARAPAELRRERGVKAKLPQCACVCQVVATARRPHPTTSIDSAPVPRRALERAARRATQLPAAKKEPRVERGHERVALLAKRFLSNTG